MMFSRATLLLGDDKMQRLNQMRVILFGVGGVGSWCAETLIRTGVGHLTLVDFDKVAESNINRQLPATSLTVGEPKVEAMRRHLLEINPDADIVAIESAYTPETAADFNLDDYDYVVDAIDSLRDKALLILNATRSQATLLSSMGAALRTDPTSVRVAEFWKVEGDKLAAALRQRFRRSKEFPSRKFRAVYSTQLPMPRPDSGAPHQPNGSLMQVTAVFGITLASLIIND